ncbi:MAG: hypothetical protein IJC25_02375 [Clostridia bacterium]|nr:hypothetical protein [Clostridia bacterium]
MQGLPATLDPQIETSLSAQDLFLCAFRGLLSDVDGVLTCDAAEEYTYSPDGLMLTFRLREGLTWSDGAAVTADDYAFAVERILSPETSSPYAQLLFSIDGAQEFYERKAGHIRGLSCPDDGTLQLTLCRADERLLQQFSATYLSPCRRDFFEQTAGAYGMTVSKTVFNGNYRILSKGSETAVLERAIANKKLPKSVRFRDISAFSAQTLEQQLLSGELTAAVSTHKIAHDGQLKEFDYTNAVYFLTFGQREGFAGDMQLSRILAATSAGQLQQRSNQSSVLPATYYEYWCGGLAPIYAGSAPNAKAEINALLQQYGLSQAPKMILLVPDDDYSRALSDELVTLWQKNTGLFVSREYLSAGALRSRVRSGAFDCAIFCGDAYATTPEKYYSAVAAQVPHLGIADCAAQTEAALIKTYEAEFSKSGRIFPLDAEHCYFYCAADNTVVHRDISTGCIRICEQQKVTQSAK